MKERTSNLSVTGLILGIMSVITVFGGYTALLGVVFGLFGILFSAGDAAFNGQGRQATPCGSLFLALSSVCWFRGCWLPFIFIPAYRRNLTLICTAFMTRLGRSLCVSEPIFKQTKKKDLAQCRKDQYPSGIFPNERNRSRENLTKNGNADEIFLF